MSSILCVEKSKPSALKRLSFLPRVALFVDFGGRQISYRHAPLIEAIYNMRTLGFSMKNFMEISFKQLREIELPSQLPVNLGALAKKKKRKTRKAK